jgi:hypothetical protein
MMERCYLGRTLRVVRQTVRAAGMACPGRGYGSPMERRDAEIEQQGDYKNALPSEVDDHPDSGIPRQLRTQADDEAPSVVYGESDEDQNREDQADMNQAEPDEHV